MDALVPDRFLKLTERARALAIPRKEWQIVIANGADGEAVQNGYRLLKEFTGCFAMADAILCRLECVRPPPGWTLISWAEPGWMWFPLGRHIGISLPRAGPAE